MDKWAWAVPLCGGTPLLFLLMFVASSPPNGGSVHVLLCGKPLDPLIIPHGGFIPLYLVYTILSVTLLSKRSVFVVKG